MDELKQVLDALRQMEYRHVLLNPIPLYGLIFGLIALIAGLVTRSRGAQMTALLLLVVVGAVKKPTAKSAPHPTGTSARRR